MFGINGGELVVILLVAVLVVGPERLPAYAEQLAGWVRSLRELLTATRERVATELGQEAPDVDWAALDPRRYDPRRIVREALLDEPSAGPPGAVGPRRPGATGATAGRSDVTPSGPAPFDDEAT